MNIEEENKIEDGVIGKLTVYVSPHLPITHAHGLVGLDGKYLRAEHPSILIVTRIIQRGSEKCNIPILEFRIFPWDVQPVVFELSWEGLKKLVKQGEELLKNNEKEISEHAKHRRGGDRYVKKVSFFGRYRQGSC